MILVLIRMDSKSESLDHLSDNSFATHTSYLLVLVHYSLDEVNDHLRINIDEDISNYCLDFGILSPVLFYNLMDEHFLHFLSDCHLLLVVNGRLFLWHYVPFLLEDHVLLLDEGLS